MPERSEPSACWALTASWSDWASVFSCAGYEVAFASFSRFVVGVLERRGARRRVRAPEVNCASIWARVIGVAPAVGVTTVRPATTTVARFWSS